MNRVNSRTGFSYDDSTINIVVGIIIIIIIIISDVKYMYYYFLLSMYIVYRTN